MNKAAIQRFAIQARTDLIDQVSQRAYQFGITKDGYGEANAVTVGGRALNTDEQRQRKELVEQIRQKSYTQVMEEVAYTWFNRFIALRFMEVNNYLPSHIRIFSDSTGAFKPEILNDALHLDMPGLNMDKVAEYIEKNQTEDLYRYLLLTQCNALNDALPQMFEKLGGFSELLLPNNILKQDSVLGRMVTGIPEEDWTDQVQIIGWLYQYYISEKHDQIVNIYKGTVKKEDIPAATQLFTTDWVVRYMVDNSLGRYWIERHPESKLAEKLDFFVLPKSGKIAHIDERVKPQELTFFDPCMGSGHILVYAFDVLMEIYRECGYGDRDAAVEIVKNNLFGLDIDERCSQLAYFAVMMKARSFDRRFLTRGITPHVLPIEESNTISAFTHAKFMLDTRQNEVGEYLVDLFRHAKEIGSLKTTAVKNYDGFTDYLKECASNATLDMDFSLWLSTEMPLLEHLAEQAKMLSTKYAVVCTNPPYMNKLESHLKDFVVTNYKSYSGDLFSAFMYHNFSFCKQNGYAAFMTPFVWMFIKTYEALRSYIIDTKAITTLVQMEYSAFEEATVPICSFVLKNGKPTEPAYCFRLSDFKGGMAVQKQKVLEALANKNCGYFYEAAQDNFSKIPGSPIAYWGSKKAVLAFEECSALGDLEMVRGGLTTGDNNKFLRFWFEVNKCTISFNTNSISEAGVSSQKWFPLAKGGEYRKWYGNLEYIVNWGNDGAEIKYWVTHNPKDPNTTHWSRRLFNTDCYFKKVITWSGISSGKPSMRLSDHAIFGSGAKAIIPHESFNFYLAFLNSAVTLMYLDFLSPTLNYESGHISSLPIRNADNEKVSFLVTNNIVLSSKDWDSFETSWDFKKHPLVPIVCPVNGRIADDFAYWQNECADRFNTLKANEEELNRIFIDIYGLQDELTPEVEDKDVTVRKADLGRDIRSLISYAVGCMLTGLPMPVESGMLLSTAPLFPTKTTSSPSATMTTSTMTSPDVL